MLATEVDRKFLGEAFFTFKSDWWYNFLSMTKIYERDIFPMKLKNIDELLLLLAPVFDIEEIINVSDRITLLKKSDVPTIVVFGTAEPIITTDGRNQLRDVLLIPPEQVVNIDPSNYKLDDLTLKQRQSFFLIKDARHFVHSTHSTISNQLIDNLLKF